MNERAAYARLALTPGIGHRRLGRLLTHFGSATAVLSATSASLRRVKGISPAAATAIRAAPERLHALEASLEALGAAVLLPGDPAFPPLLRSIPDPPTLLFVQGRAELLSRPSLAIVGSRDHTAYGSRVCREVAACAARHGIVVVSGMARGLDALAHSTALDGEGATVGVLGNGLGVVYPAANRSLYDRVARDGALVTEFPPGERPSRGSFPRRNRLVSGLATVTIVIEAARGSGALITAGAALEQGRDVMAVPGGIHELTARGVNELIRDGAEPLLDPDDFLRHFPECSSMPPAGRAVLPMLHALRGVPRAVAELLLEGGVDLDTLAERASLEVGEILPVLSSLEIHGVVRRAHGSRFELAQHG